MLERTALAAAQLDRLDNQQHVLHRDYETRGVVSLGKCGVHRYAADSRTEVLCCAYAIDNEPAKLWTPGDAVPAEFHEAATNPNWLAVAHNAAFEMAIEELLLARASAGRSSRWNGSAARWRWRWRWRCPARLEKLADALELSRRKDVAGHRLMLRMTKPRRPRKGEDPDRTLLVRRSGAAAAALRLLHG